MDPFASALDQAAAVRRREVSSAELTRAYIERIERLNPRLNAYVLTTPELALEQAKAADAANIGYPLRGVPTSIKDNVSLAGYPITFGSRAFEDYTLPMDFFPVARIKEEGCTILGKTNLSEFGTRPTVEHGLFGPTHNPWNPDHSAGGSSGGAAAAGAAGLCAFAHGTDGGGSVRIPASCCGTGGLKPSRGRISAGAPPRGDLGGPSGRGAVPPAGAPAAWPASARCRSAMRASSSLSMLWVSHWRGSCPRSITSARSTLSGCTAAWSWAFGTRTMFSSPRRCREPRRASTPWAQTSHPLATSTWISSRSPTRITAPASPRSPCRSGSIQRGFRSGSSWWGHLAARRSSSAWPPSSSRPDRGAAADPTFTSDEASRRRRRGARAPPQSAERHPADAGHGQGSHLQPRRSGHRRSPRPGPLRRLWRHRHRGAVARRRPGHLRGQGAPRSCYPAPELGRPRAEGESARRSW